jgi:Na+-driven multidrug efflux pump
MQRLLHYGWPAGVSVVAEAWSFAIIMMIVGNLGEQAAAATTLALGVNVLAFIPLIGLGIAVGVLVGKYLVQQQVDRAHRVIQAALIIGIAYSSVFAVLYGLFPEYVMNIYAIGNDPERFEAIRPQLKPLLYFIAAYCVFDAFQVIFAGVLKGAGDTMTRASTTRVGRTVLLVERHQYLGHRTCNILYHALPSGWMETKKSHRTRFDRRCNSLSIQTLLGAIKPT